jgi:hypothetical protein
MSITPEQFNKLATKDDLKDLEQKLVSKSEFSDMLNTLDGVAKNVKDIKSDQAANLDAHNRLQEDINEVRGHVGLDIKHPNLGPEVA